MEFANSRTIPPGGHYFYEVPETRVLIKDLTYGGAIARIRKNYAENGLPVPEDLEKRVIDFMCRLLPKGFCQGADDGKPRPRMMLMSEVKRTTAAAAATKSRVTPGEANRRALICGGCPLNDRSGCPTCSGLNAWASKLGGVPVPGGATYLGICKADGLAMSAGVALEHAPAVNKAPENCWRRAKHEQG